MVDSHPVVGLALTALAKSRWKDVGTRTADSVESAEVVIADGGCDLVIGELFFPDGDFFDLILSASRTSRDVRSLVFSQHCERRFGLRAMREGVGGYVMKTERIPTLLSAIDTVMSGGSHWSNGVRDYLVNSFASKEMDGGVSRLSPREFQVFRLLGEGLSAKEIAGRLGLSTKTINSHRENMKEKLNCASASRIALLARDWFASGDAAGFG